MTPPQRYPTTPTVCSVVIPAQAGIQHKTPSRSDSLILNSPFLIHNCFFRAPRDSDTLPKTHLKKQTQFQYNLFVNKYLRLRVLSVAHISVLAARVPGIVMATSPPKKTKKALLFA
jgi:hypothetical protein